MPLPGLVGWRCEVTKFVRCEAPFLHYHEIEWTIKPSLRAQKP